MKSKTIKIVLKDGEANLNNYVCPYCGGQGGLRVLGHCGLNAEHWLIKCDYISCQQQSVAIKKTALDFIVRR